MSVDQSQRESKALEHVYSSMALYSASSEDETADGSTTLLSDMTLTSIPTPYSVIGQCSLLSSTEGLIK